MCYIVAIFKCEVLHYNTVIPSGVIIFKYLVTSALTYVNNIPHLGTVTPLVSADAYVRFLRLRGEDVVFVSGSDDYGTPTTVQAQIEGVTPQELVEKYSKLQKEIFIDGFCIKFDKYSNTSVPEHIPIVQDIYRKIKKNGFVYQKEIEQLYCKKCRRFLPDRYVEGLCPHCGESGARGDQCDACGKLIDPLELKDPYCVTCKGKPVVKKSEHIFFALSKLQRDLEKWIKGNKHWLSQVRNFALGWIKEGLHDRCISRDLEWGVPVPDLPGKVFYVWFDAVLGYVTACKQIGKQALWQDKDVRIVHFLGKDNVAFHAVFLPAIFKAAGSYKLAWQIPSNEYINYEGGKFSKSKNRGIFADQALKIYPADYWRYYLLANRPEKHDTDFTWKDFQEKINSDLNDDIGNFVHRVLTLNKKFFECKVPDAKLADKDKKMLGKVKTTAEDISTALYAFELRKALHKTVEIARLGNEYLSAEEPWKKENEKRRGIVIYACLQICKALGVYLEPFIPLTADRIKAMLCLPPLKWDQALEPLQAGIELKAPLPLFKKIEDAEIAVHEKKFAGK